MVPFSAEATSPLHTDRSWSLLSSEDDKIADERVNTQLQYVKNFELHGSFYS
jgi:hypothetical protein